MQSGVDDFFIKPVKAESLVENLWSAVLRRRAWLPLPDARSETSALVIDKKRRAVTWHGQPLPLTPIEFGLLEHLSSRPDTTIGFSELFAYCKGKMCAPDIVRNTLKRHIVNLREKLEQNGKYPRAIVNIWGQGFKWVEESAVSKDAD
jgi:DNA-binding response OmpR family regulator